MQWNERTEILLEPNQYQALSNAHVLVAGLGGVGGIASEFLARAGVGSLTIVDNDIISENNRNRQLVALNSTTGKKKTEVCAQRLLDINPQLKLNACDIFLNENTIPELFKKFRFDYVIDAIDTLTPKTLLIKESLTQKIPLISSMGSGAKFDPSLIQITDISQTRKCPLAKRVRDKLRDMGIISGFQAVFSTEDFDRAKFIKTPGLLNKKTTVGSISYMPAIFGGYCASEVIRNLIFSAKS